MKSENNPHSGKQYSLVKEAPSWFTVNGETLHVPLGSGTDFDLCQVRRQGHQNHLQQHAEPPHLCTGCAVVSAAGHKQTEPLNTWNNVAAEPLHNEPLAQSLPTGNVSRPAMWNPFLLEGTKEQSHCLETQLSVPELFFSGGPQSVEDTNLHHTTPRKCTRSSKKDHHVLNSLASSDLLLGARGIWGPKTKQRWRNAVFLPPINHWGKFCLLRRSAGSPRLSCRRVLFAGSKPNACCPSLWIGVCQVCQTLFRQMCRVGRSSVATDTFGFMSSKPEEHEWQSLCLSLWMFLCPSINGNLLCPE